MSNFFRIAIKIDADDAVADEASSTAGKPSEIMDVNADTVADVMRRHQVSLLLHGHTHRPAVHHFELDGRQATRIVLGDWHEQGSALRWDASGYELLTLPR